MAEAAERLVSRDSFGELLALLTENVVSLTRIGYEALDLVWHNLRLAGRQDVARLARQLGRTEDKLEDVLQEVERLRDAVEAAQAASGDGASPRRSASAGGNSSGGMRNARSSPT